MQNHGSQQPFCYRTGEKERMEAYTGFAEVYDLFMDNVPYEEWCEYIKDILCHDGINAGLGGELGCGTG